MPVAAACPWCSRSTVSASCTSCACCSSRCIGCSRAASLSLACATAVLSGAYDWDSTSRLAEHCCTASSNLPPAARASASASAVAPSSSLCGCRWARRICGAPQLHELCRVHQPQMTTNSIFEYLPGEENILVLNHRHTCMHLRRAAAAWAGSEVCDAWSNSMRACCSCDSSALRPPLGSPWSHLLADDNWLSLVEKKRPLSCKCRQHILMVKAAGCKCAAAAMPTSCTSPPASWRGCHAAT